MLDEDLPEQAHDFRVDLIVTPQRIIWPGTPNGLQSSTWTASVPTRSRRYQCWRSGYAANEITVGQKRNPL